MTKRVLYRNFTNNSFVVNKYRRGIYEIWDANLHHGDIRPFACPEIICSDYHHLERLYPLNNCQCFGFGDTRDIVKGFAIDQYFHIHDGKLFIANEIDLCAGMPGIRAGSPFNNNPPSVSGSCSGCDAVSVSYVVTYIADNYGALIESAPSKPSFPVTCKGSVPGCSVSWGPVPGAGEYNIVESRLYRVESTFDDGTSHLDIDGSEYVYVASMGPDGGTFVDNVPTSQTGEPLLTYDPLEFPAPDNLIGLTRISDGIAVCSQDQVYFSFPGRPHFTFGSVVNIEDRIRAIASLEGGTVFVLTEKFPVSIKYSLNSSIYSFSRNVIQRKLPLTSIKSVSSYGTTIFFASEYSLYLWDSKGYGEDIKSGLKQILTPEQWKNIDPYSVTGTAYEYGYIFSSDNIDYSLMVEYGGDGTDTISETSIMPISYINGHVYATDNEGHIMYQQGNDIYRWDYRREFCLNDEEQQQIRRLSISKTADKTIVGHAGEIIEFTFVVTNDGNVSLPGPFTIIDDFLHGLIGNISGPLAPGSSKTVNVNYEVTQADINRGFIANTAYVTGNGVVSSNVSLTINVNANSSLELVVTKTSDTYTREGEIITYYYTVRNNGNVLVDPPFTITDTVFGTFNNLPANFLYPGESFTYPYNHVITQSDIDNGFINNDSTASNGTVTSNTVSTNVNAINTVDVAFKKRCDKHTYSSVGEVLTYTFTIQNTGNTTITGDFDIDDNVLGQITCTNTSLAPGDSVSCTAQYTVTQIDIDNGNISNEADLKQNNIVLDNAEHNINADINNSITLKKDADKATYTTIGEVITYTYEIKNTGNTILQLPITIHDDVLGDIDVGTGLLNPGDTITVQETHIVSQADIDAGSVSNTASVIDSTLGITEYAHEIVTYLSEGDENDDNNNSPTEITINMGGG